MFLFCPKCNAQHSSMGRCPRCSSRLLSPVEAADMLPKTVPSAAPNTQIHSTFPRRVVVGVLLALGFHLTLREWTLATLGIMGMSTEVESWEGLNFAIRALSTLIGAVVAGAGLGFAAMVPSFLARAVAAIVACLPLYCQSGTDGRDDPGHSQCFHVSYRDVRGMMKRAETRAVS